MPRNRGKGGGARHQGTYYGGLGTDNAWGNTLFQPDFDKRMALTFSGANKLEKGRIVPVNPKTGTGTKTDNYGVRFMYNPSTLNIGYSADPSAYLQGENDVKNQKGDALGSGFGTLSFNLAFDRTYETWQNAGKIDPGNTNDPELQVRKFGCYVDIRQFYLMLGIIEPGTNQPEIHGSHGTSQGGGGVGIPSNVFQSFSEDFGPMLVTPVQVYFGGTKALNFFGVFSTFSVTYSHFTSQMTPVRAIVNLTMDLRKKSKLQKATRNATQRDENRDAKKEKKKAASEESS